MNSRLKRIVFPLFSFVSLVALACTCLGSGVSPTPTDVPPPTNPPPTKPPVTLPTEAPATKPPIGGGGGEIVLSSTPFAHQSGAFTITLPEGWEVTESNNSVIAVSPDGVASVSVYFENAGVALDSQSFTNYMNSIEQNFYGTYESYSQTSVEPQDDGSTGIFKTLVSDGVEYTVSTYYWQDGNTLFIEDWWVATDQYDALSEGLLEVINTLIWVGSAAENDTLYPIRYTYTCPGSLCTFSVPYGWLFSQDTQYDNTLVDIFSAPDNQSKVDNLAYDDGTEINKSVAGAFALGLLKQFYAEDVVITDDTVQSDGSERLIWYSQSGGYSGTSFFETRGTTFLMLTWLANDAYYDLYFPVWTGLLETYSVP